MQIVNTSRNLINVGVQTDTVVITSSDDEAAAFHKCQPSKRSSTVATITQTLLPGLTSSAQHTGDLCQTLTSPKDVSNLWQTTAVSDVSRITIVNKKTTIHQDNINATNEVFFYMIEQHKPAQPIATNDDFLEILLSTTTRDNNISDYTIQIGQDHQLIRKESKTKTLSRFRICIFTGGNCR